MLVKNNTIKVVQHCLKVLKQLSSLLTLLVRDCQNQSRRGQEEVDTFSNCFTQTSVYRCPGSSVVLSLILPAVLKFKEEEEKVGENLIL